jgi:hypothetical protein
VIDKIVAFKKLIRLGNTVCLNNNFFEITEIDIIIDIIRITINILINNLGMLWEAIRVDRIGILELPPKTPGGNLSEKRLPIRVSPF